MSFQGIDPWSIRGNQSNVERAVIPVESTLEDLHVEILDEESNKGRFGWLCMEQNHYLPYIYRYGSEPYVSVKMLEKKLLNRYLEVLPVDIPSCTSIRSFYVTDTEARLLNDINIIHCDGIFGKEIFTNQDLVVTLEDVKEFHQFVVLCHKKLVMKKSRSRDRCGFFKMTDSGESILPYIVKNEVKLVPVFYLEGETKRLDHLITEVKGWDLPYLRFCFKVQGVKSSLYSGDNLLVVNIQDIKTEFSAGSTLEEYWPDQGRIEAVSPYRRGVGSALGKWLQRPVNMIQQPGIQIQVGDGGQLKIQSGHDEQPQVEQDSGKHWQIQPGDHGHLQIEPMNWELLQMYLGDGTHLPIQSGDGQPQIQSGGDGHLQVHTKDVGHLQIQPGYGEHLRMQSGEGGHRQIQPGGSGYPQIQPGDGGNLLIQPPNNGHLENLRMLSGQLPSLHIGSYPLSNVQLGLSLVQIRQLPECQLEGAIQQQHTVYQQEVSRAGKSGLHVDLSLSQTQHQQTINVFPGNLTLIKEFPIVPNNSNEVPYQIREALIEQKLVPCINVRPFQYLDLMMSLPEFLKYFFPDLSVEKAKEMMDTLKIVLYKGNTGHQDLLRRWRMSLIFDPVPLILIKDILTHLFNMRYFLSSQPAKRSRLV